MKKKKRPQKTSETKRNALVVQPESQSGSFSIQNRPEVLGCWTVLRSRPTGSDSQHWLRARKITCNSVLVLTPLVFRTERSQFSGGRRDSDTLLNPLGN